MESQKIKFKDIPLELLKKGEYGEKITEYLTRLGICIKSYYHGCMCHLLDIKHPFVDCVCYQGT